MNDSHDSLIGQTISDRYAIHARLGEGGVAVVYRGEHTLMKKAVAIKVLKPEAVSNPELVERFKREAQAIAQIDHPRVCGATDFGRLDDDRFFLVMELLRGQTLHAELQEKITLAPLRAMQIARQVADGLSSIHELGILHRDVKPSNIQILEDGPAGPQVKILDFGFARETARTSVTKVGMAMGTPSYIAPEIWRGEEAEPGSDLYNLGVVLFECLTGRRPFVRESTAQLLRAHVSEPAPDVREFAPATPPALAALVAMLLAKYPHERPPTAQGLVERLDRMIADAESAAMPAEPASLPAAASAAPVAKPAKDWREEWGWLAELGRELWAWSADRFVALPMPARAGVVVAALALVALPPLASALLSMGDGMTEDLGDDEEALVFATDEVASIDRDVAGERELFIEEKGLVEVLAGKDASTRVDALQARSAELEASPHFHYLLGLTQWEAGQKDKAMAAFRLAVDIEPRYAAEPGLLGRATERLARRDEPSEHTTRLVEAALATADPTPAREALYEVAVEGHWNGRKRARDLLQKSGQWEKLAPWQQTAINLQLTGKDCERVRKYVRELADSGEPAALPVLEKTARRPSKGCGFFSGGDCYACMRDDLKKAMASLRSSAR